MRRICCFCESWESGGIESFLRNVLLNMDLSELEIDIVAAAVKQSVFTAELEAKGIRFIELSGKLRSPGNFRVFRELLRDRKYEVVHFNLFQGLSLYYAQIAKEEGVPVRIAHSHNTALRKSFGRVIKLMLHRLGSRSFTAAATDLWACSGVAAEFLFSRKVLERKGFRFVPNGIETDRFRFDRAVRDAVRAELGVSDAFVIGHVGRFCYQKNQEFLLDVLAETLKYRPESRLLLIGEGDEKARLKEKTEVLGIADKVIFYGVTDRVETLMWAMDVFAFPSRFEGLGIVAVEAQAAGLPTVCSEHIPAEAFVVSLMQRKSLEDGVREWAETIVSAHAEKSREMMANEIRTKGFAIDDVARTIGAYYRGIAE